MTTQFLAADIARDEGLRLKAYPDPLSPRARTGKGSGAPWTIGYGATGADITEGTIWTQAQATARLLKDIAEVEAELDRNLSWWRQLTDERQDVLANLCFNLGVKTLLDFHTFLGLVDQGNYTAAADDLLATKAGRELPKRYARLATQLRTGVRA